MKTFGYAIRGWGDLIRIDSVELPLVLRSGDFWIPENERTAANNTHKCILPFGFPGQLSSKQTASVLQSLKAEDGVTRFC